MTECKCDDGVIYVDGGFIICRECNPDIMDVYNLGARHAKEYLAKKATDND